MKQASLFAAQLETPLGMMLAIADEKELFFLDFVDRHAVVRLNQKLAAATLGSSVGEWIGEERWEHLTPTAFFQEEPCHLSRLERKIKRLRVSNKAIIIPGVTPVLRSLEQELVAYFEGTLKQFKTPFRLPGTVFQQASWKALLEVPYGETKSYADQAAAVGNPTAVRAVANANGANQLALILPCHRIISSDGGLGGYGSGLARKAWLLEHERKYQGWGSVTVLLGKNKVRIF